tara:strand:- start:114 stop:617 length:504 start_codon:yes stop_codon:yes gene_type:complete
MRQGLISTALLLLAVNCVNAQDYKVNFPCNPETEIVKSYHKDLGIITRYVDLCLEDYPNKSYAFSKTTYSEAYINANDYDVAVEQLVGAMNQSVEKVSGNLLSNFIEDYNGFPSVRFKVSIRDGQYIIASRLIAIENTLYQLSVSTKSELSFNKKASDFLASFGREY